MRQRGILRGYDGILLVLVFVLVTVGIVMVYSASFKFAAERHGSGDYFLKRQLVFAALGILAMMGLMRFDYRVLRERKAVYGILLGILLLLVLVLIPGIGVEVNGTRRWMRLGPLNVQPAELAKFGVILFLARSLVEKRDRIRTFEFGFLPHILIPGVFALMILAQPDFGNAVIVGAIAMIMMFAAGVRWRYLTGLGLAGLAGVAALVAVSPYRLKRVMVFLNPWEDPQGSCYQIVQSLIAFGSGGLFGKGLGEGRQKLFYLPELHTDFIFSNVGEELGLAGVLVMMILFVLLIYRAFRIALLAPDRFGTMLGFGIASLLALQVTINMGVVMSILPTKGLVLPFISYGGSSLLVSLGMVGILLSISSRSEAFLERSRAGLVNTRRPGVFEEGG